MGWLAGGGAGWKGGGAGWKGAGVGRKGVSPVAALDLQYFVLILILIFGQI